MRLAVAVWRLIRLFVSMSLAMEAAPRRIVSTAPSFTETVYAIGAGARLVAVSSHCHYPVDVEKLPRIGSYLKPNIEAIARMKPDLVLVHAEQKQALAQLAGLGIPTLALRNTSLEETLGSAREIGVALGIADAGTALGQSLRAQLAAIEKRTAGKPRRTLLFVVGRTPGQLGGMIAVGKGSFLNEVIRIAGGRNVLADSPVTYPRISIEAVMRLDPDVIVDMGDMAVTTGVTEQHIRAVVQLWRDQPGIRAAAKNNVFAVAADIFVVPGPRISQAAEAFARMMHPEDAR